jgi:hypothetical protein
MSTCFKFLLLAAIVQLSAVSFVLDQNNTYPYPIIGRVGIGTTDPQAKLHANGHQMPEADGSMGIGVTDTKGYLLAIGGMIAEKIQVKIKTA